MLEEATPENPLSIGSILEMKVVYYLFGQNTKIPSSQVAGAVGHSIESIRRTLLHLESKGLLDKQVIGKWGNGKPMEGFSLTNEGRSITIMLAQTLDSLLRR